MATIVEKLTVTEFENRFGEQKPYYEFWRGEALQKAMPTWIHGLLQRILLDILSRAGYKSASEVKVKIEPDLQLIPDVIATSGPIELPYPLRAIEIVIEILSETDTVSRILSKCRAYHRWGVEQIYVVDPEARVVFRWEGNRLQEVDTFAGMPTGEIWESLKQQLS